MPLTYSALDVFAPTTANGTPRGPDLGEAQVWAHEIETLVSGLAAPEPPVELVADLPSGADDDSWGFVVGESDPADNGIYRKISGTWTRLGPLVGSPAEATSSRDRYTTALTGDGTGSPIPYPVVTTPRGQAFQIGGAGVLALRDRVNLQGGQRYRLRAQFLRHTDPTDPSGATVRVRLRWLDNAFATVGNTTLYDETLTEAMGVQVVDVTIGAAGSNATHVPPSGAVYCVPYIQTFDVDGVTRVEQLELFVALPHDYPQANTLYVSVTGDDDAPGTSEEMPLLTIERALELATDRAAPTLIRLGAGTYVTRGNLDMPDDCSVIAAHRAVTIVPEAGFEQRNVFRMGSGCFLEGPTFAGWEIDDLDDPRVGFAVCFRPGATIRRVPYAHKIVAYRGMPPQLVAAPLDRANGNPDVGNGMGVCIADGATISAFSAFPNIMTWGGTPSNPNGIGYVARNKALVNAVNAVSLWCHKHHLALGGGQVILSSCSTQFGDYSLWAEGWGQSLRLPTVTAYAALPDASDIIATAADDIVDDMWDELVSGGFTAGWTASDEAFTRRDAAIFLTAVGYALEEGRQRAIDEFARGLFMPQEDPVDPAICRLVPVFDADKKAAFQASFTYMGGRVQALGGINAAADTAVGNLVAMLNAALDDPEFRKERSLVTAIGHQWTYPLAGVTRSAVPPVFGGSGRASRIARSVRQRKGGRVQFSGQDDQGNAVFVGGLEINARTGQLGGRPFDSAVELRSIEAAIATGSY